MNYIYKPLDIKNLYFNKKIIYYISQIENILNKDKNKLDYPICIIVIIIKLQKKDIH